MSGRSKSSDLLRPLAIQFLLLLRFVSLSSSSCSSSPLVSGCAGLKVACVFGEEEDVDVVEEGESAGEGEEGEDFDDLGVIVLEGQDALLVCLKPDVFFSSCPGEAARGGTGARGGTAGGRGSGLGEISED